MGGGLWTCASVPLLAKAGLYVTLAVVTFIFCCWLALWKFYFLPRYSPICKCKLCDMRTSRSLLDNNETEYTAAEYGGGHVDEGDIYANTSHADIVIN